MDIIKNNPYRILGVYANSPTKERIANLNKLKAFLKVGKTMDFPLDLPQYLPPLSRTTEIVSHADACLSLPNEQLKYAQFWFIKANPVDDIAFNHLFAGNIDNAIAIWEKVDNVFSLQNRIVCSLIKKDYKAAFSYAELFYSYYQEKFVQEICGDNIQNPDSLLHIFLDALCSELGTSKVLYYLPNHEWEKHVKEKVSISLIDNIQSAIEAAKNVKREDAQTRYNAGIKLKDNAIEFLKELKLIGSDLQYQQIADKLGLEILQCGIDYLNSSVEKNETRRAKQAMQLLKCARSIVVSRMAKERCRTNLDELNDYIKKLPPENVYDEDQLIRNELMKFYSLPHKISHAVTLLNNCMPILQNVKIKLGTSNIYYLKVSTFIVDNALNNIIEEVNDAQRTGDSKRHLKFVLKSALNAIKEIEMFDMEGRFKEERFYKNRTILYSLCSSYNVIKPPLKEYLKSEDSSGWQAALLLSIIVPIVAIGNSELNQKDLMIGCGMWIVMCFLVYLYDKDNDSMFRTPKGRVGCGYAVFMIYIFVTLVMYKCIKWLLNFIKR